MKLTKKSRLLIAAAFAASLVMTGCGKTQIGYIDGDRIIMVSLMGMRHLKKLFRMIEGVPYRHIRRLVSIAHLVKQRRRRGKC